VGRLNPGWNEKGVDIQSRFMQAVEMTGREFTDTVMHTYKVARATVLAIDTWLITIMTIELDSSP
jgi:hypothetical protein